MKLLGLTLLLQVVIASALVMARVIFQDPVGGRSHITSMCMHISDTPHIKRFKKRFWVQNGLLQWMSGWNKKQL